MKKIVLLFSGLLVLNIIASAQKIREEEAVVANDSLQAEIQAYLDLSDSVINAMKYQQGVITLKGDFAKLNVPAGFKFLDAEQSQYILHDIWGNPERPDVLGMIFPEEGTPYTDSSYVFVISFDDMGYVKDDDAMETDYDELLKQMQDDEAEENKQRLAAGYSSIHMAGWAQKPFYDENRKVLHWAKDLVFSDANGMHTLNYDVRVLGRKGVLSLNAIASISELPLVKANIDKILTIASFTEGNAYADFDDNTDKIAAYTIGGLVAGKVLAKVGLWALILKFWKLIAGGVIAAFYAIRKWLTGRKKPEEELAVETVSNDPGSQPEA